jgi:FADH2-dependent halogenase
MFLIEQGIEPLIIEREQFPRYHVGESLTGEGGRILRELGLEAELLRRGYPRKQGVRVYGASSRGTWWVPVSGRDADWQMFDWETWQVRRSDFDTMMLDEAQRRGARLLHARATRPLVGSDGSPCGLEVRRDDGTTLRIETDMLLDCSGQATFLANHGVTGPKYRGSYDRQIAIFSQVADAVRDQGDTRELHPDNTLIFYQRKYHWSWFIPLDERVVSVGVVIPAAYFQARNESPREFLIRELRELHPELARRLPEVQLVEDVHAIPNYSYQVRRFCGKGYICIGDAHRFVDPIFSFGLTLSLREAQLAAPLVRAYLEGAGREAANPFAEHQRRCEQGIDVLEDAIDLFWEQPLVFALSVHHRHTPEMADMFAGRIFEHQPSAPILDFRALLGRQHERTYESADDYSVPIGSRYQPERAPLWQPDPALTSTEDWITHRT